jgi:hypothetical protein
MKVAPHQFDVNPPGLVALAAPTPPKAAVRLLSGRRNSGGESPTGRGKKHDQHGLSGQTD